MESFPMRSDEFMNICYVDIHGIEQPVFQHRSTNCLTSERNDGNKNKDTIDGIPYVPLRWFLLDVHINLLNLMLSRSSRPHNPRDTILRIRNSKAPVVQFLLSPWRPSEVVATMSLRQ